MKCKDTICKAIRLGWFSFLFGCSVYAQSPTVSNPVTTAQVLQDTQWQLVAFESMDDAQGTKHPENPSKYTMQLNKDGTVFLKLNCNSARGRWSAKPSEDEHSGSFSFSPLTVTRALCPPPSMDGHISSHTQHIKSYLLKDGRLYLSLMADGGIYVWEPSAVSVALSEEMKKFDASGTIPCAKYKGQPKVECPFGVARGKNGTATVHITHPDGSKRVLFFENGVAVGADLSQADGSMEFSAKKESDLFLIHAGDGRYEVPEAVIFGG